MNVALIGPVFPYRAGIAYCTTRLGEELAKTNEVEILSFKRQYPRRFYPGGEDIDETLRSRTPAGARFDLDVVNPISWIRTAMALRRSRPDAAILVWWIWVWALPYLTILALLPKKTRVILQCHNIGDKEPAWWKRALTNRVLRRGDVLVVHAKSEAAEAARRIGVAQTLLSVSDQGQKFEAQTRVSVPHIETTFLPVHELGGAVPSREAARSRLGIASKNVALFFGHVRPFKALDVALRAWAKLKTTDALLVVAGEAWWNSAEEYRGLGRELALRIIDPPRDIPLPTGEGRPALPDQFPQSGARGVHLARSSVTFDFRFIPDSEIATYFAAADVVLAPYRVEAQSGVALTAFHFARPVIATTVGGLPEIIAEGENGYLVPPDDPDALAAAIDRFFERGDREKMERAAAAVAKRCSWEEYGRLFSRLLTGG